MKEFVILNHLPFYRQGLKAFLNDRQDSVVVAEGQSAKELAKQGKFSNSRIVIIDLDSPGLNAVEEATYLKKKFPQTEIIGMSEFDKSQDILDLIRIGVNGLVGKSCDREELEQAIEKVSNHQDYFSKRVVEIIIQTCAKVNPAVKELIKSDQFSTREIEIIKMICQQKTAKEIGKEMFVCEKTVDFHRHKIIDKMNVRNIVGLVVYAIKNNLVRIEEL